MIITANTYLTFLRNEAIEEEIDVVYDDYIDRLTVGYEEKQSAVWSYDADAICYGEK